MHAPAKFALASTYTLDGVALPRLSQGCFVPQTDTVLPHICRPGLDVSDRYLHKGNVAELHRIWTFCRYAQNIVFPLSPCLAFVLPILPPRSTN